MTYSMLSNEDKQLIDYLSELESVPLLAHQLTNPLRENTKASIAVAFGLISKATLFTQEMGIGKTYIAMGLIENILRIDPTKKVMFCGTNDKLKEYIGLFKENISPNFGVTWTTAEEYEVRGAFRELDNGASVLISTHSVWDKGSEFHKAFIEHIDDFQAVIVDEGGMLFKNNDNYSYRMMVTFMPNMKYRYILNATPIERDLTPLVNQCRLLGIPIPSKGKLYAMYGNVDDDDYKWIFRNLNQLKEDLRYHIFNISRDQIETAGKIEYDLRCYLLRVERNQQEMVNEDGSRSVRFPFLYPDYFMPQAYPSLRKLIEICREGKIQGDKMLVFVRNVEPKVAIKSYLESQGLSVGIYDGYHTDTRDKKAKVEAEFNEGKYDVLLTNKIYGLSLMTANHIIMYDLPSNFYQYIYRAIRDLKYKNLKVSIMAYDFPNDYETIVREINDERYQNEFSSRNFHLIEEMQQQLNLKANSNRYD